MVDRIHARCFVIRADFRDEFDESGTWNPVLKAVVPTDQNVYLFSATHPTLTPRFRVRGKLSHGTTKKNKNKNNKHLSVPSVAGCTTFNFLSFEKRPGSPIYLGDLQWGRISIREGDAFHDRLFSFVLLFPLVEDPVGGRFWTTLLNRKFRRGVPFPLYPLPDTFEKSWLSHRKQSS